MGVSFRPRSLANTSKRMRCPSRVLARSSTARGAEVGLTPKSETGAAPGEKSVKTRI